MARHSIGINNNVPLLLQGCIFSVPKNIDQNSYKEYYESWIKPYLTLAYDNPTIPFFFYISGIVLEIFEDSYKECKVIFQELLKRNQIELLGGLYYDSAPLLQTAKAQREQLEKLSHHIKRNYKILTKGIWVTPGTFDNASIPAFKKMGAHYLFAERAYIESINTDLRVGLLEEKGETLPVYVYDKMFINKLQEIEKNIVNDRYHNGLTNFHRSYIICAEYHDIADKEKYFTFLQRLQEIIKNKNTIYRCILPKALYRHNEDNRQLCRIRTTAYGDEENETFLKQILYRPESRLLYGMFQYYAQKIERYKKDKTLKKSAQLMFMETQNHFLFWSFNRPWGIQNINLRQSAYKIFASIHKTLKDVEVKKTTNIQLLHTDINLDGKEEFVFTSPSFTVVSETTHGALCVLQSKNRNKSWNYCGCYCPQRNAQYAPWAVRESIVPIDCDVRDIHIKMLENQYQYAPVTFSKASLNRTLASLIFSEGRSPALENFSNTHSIFQDKNLHENKQHQDTAFSKLKYNETDALSLEKQYTFKTNAIQVQYRLANDSITEYEVYLMIELNLAFSSDDEKALEIYTPDKIKNSDKKAQKFSSKTLSFVHLSQKENIHFTFSKIAHIHFSPVHSTNNFFPSETLYQYNSVLVAIPIKILSFGYEELFFTINFSTHK